MMIRPQQPTDRNRVKTKETKESLEELIESEKRFIKQFEDWEALFIEWKGRNVNNSDKHEYRETELKMEMWREQLVQKRNVVKKRREEKEVEIAAMKAFQQKQTIVFAEKQSEKYSSYAFESNPVGIRGGPRCRNETRKTGFRNRGAECSVSPHDDTKLDFYRPHGREELISNEYHASVKGDLRNSASRTREGIMDAYISNINKPKLDDTALKKPPPALLAAGDGAWNQNFTRNEVWDKGTFGEPRKQINLDNDVIFQDTYPMEKKTLPSPWITKVNQESECSESIWLRPPSTNAKGHEQERSSYNAWKQESSLASSSFDESAFDDGSSPFSNEIEQRSNLFNKGSKSREVRDSNKAVKKIPSQFNREQDTRSDQRFSENGLKRRYSPFSREQDMKRNDAFNKSLDIREGNNQRFSISSPKRILSPFSREQDMKRIDAFNKSLDIRERHNQRFSKNGPKRIPSLFSKEPDMREGDTFNNGSHSVKKSDACSFKNGPEKRLQPFSWDPDTRRGDAFNNGLNTEGRTQRALKDGPVQVPSLFSREPDMRGGNIFNNGSDTRERGAQCLLKNVTEPRHLPFSRELDTRFCDAFNKDLDTRDGCNQRPLKDGPEERLPLFSRELDARGENTPNKGLGNREGHDQRSSKNGMITIQRQNALNKSFEQSVQQKFGEETPWKIPSLLDMPLAKPPWLSGEITAEDDLDDGNRFKKHVSKNKAAWCVRDFDKGGEVLCDSLRPSLSKETFEGFLLADEPYGASFTNEPQPKKPKLREPAAGSAHTDRKLTNQNDGKITTQIQGSFQAFQQEIFKFSPLSPIQQNKYFQQNQQPLINKPRRQQSKFDADNFNGYNQRKGIIDMEGDETSGINGRVLKNSLNNHAGIVGALQMEHTPVSEVALPSFESLQVRKPNPPWTEATFLESLSIFQYNCQPATLNGYPIREQMECSSIYEYNHGKPSVPTESERISAVPSAIPPAQLQNGSNNPAQMNFQIPITPAPLRPASKGLLQVLEAPPPYAGGPAKDMLSPQGSQLPLIPSMEDQLQDVPTECCIRKIPNEVFPKIFSELNLLDLANVSLVCRRFNELSMTARITLVISENTDLEIMVNRRSELQMHREKYDESNLINLSQSEKFGKLIIGADIEHENAGALMPLWHLKNLKTLRIDKMDFGVGNIKPFWELLNSFKGSLRSLYIGNIFSDDDTLFPPHYVPSPSVMLTGLKKFYSSYFSNEDNLDIISANQNTLETIKFYILGKPKMEMMVMLSQCPNLTKLSFNSHYPCEFQFSHLFANKPIYIEFGFFCSFGKLLRFWKVYPHVTKLVINNYVEDDYIVDDIVEDVNFFRERSLKSLQNFPMVKRLKIHFQRSQWKSQPLNCSNVVKIASQFKNLIELKIGFNWDETELDMFLLAFRRVPTLQKIILYVEKTPKVEKKWLKITSQLRARHYKAWFVNKVNKYLLIVRRKIKM